MKYCTWAGHVSESMAQPKTTHFGPAQENMRNENCWGSNMKPRPSRRLNKYWAGPTDRALWQRCSETMCSLGFLCTSEKVATVLLALSAWSPTVCTLRQSIALSPYHPPARCRRFTAAVHMQLSLQSFKNIEKHRVHGSLSKRYLCKQWTRFMTFMKFAWLEVSARTWRHLIWLAIYLPFSRYLCQWMTLMSVGVLTCPALRTKKIWDL